MSSLPNFLLATLLLFFHFALAQSPTYDIVVYGGTSAGVAAAIQGSRTGKTVLLIEPTDRIGGLTTGGLGQTDIGNKQAIGGIAREFYTNIKRYYDDPAHWVWQERSAYRDRGQTRTESGEASMWTFEPSAALAVLRHMLAAEDGITLIYGQRLDREGGVVRADGAIRSIGMENGPVYTGRVFIDATYEGDLMAAAGVSYTIGRESNRQYGETLNGVQPNAWHPTLTGGLSKNNANHNFLPGVDPYVVPGDPGSGLLPGVNEKPGLPGAADDRIQAYCFRMCLTDHPDNRIPFAKPAGYREQDYELLFRNYERASEEPPTGGGYQHSLLPWINSPMPNRKTDTNNRLGFSTDYIGANYAYPEASYAEREAIVEAHRTYQQGLMWTLANHPRIPAAIREEVSRWGTTKDEFARADGWQQQLYIREARRMLGTYVMTQHNCEGLEVTDRPVGMAAYGMDSHNTQRYLDENGYVQNEGNVEAGGIRPYPIAFGAIIPRREECTNLLVPVCVSATHIAFGSIRMEPVFMVLGQSAATAAALAIDGDTSVQELDYEVLRERLLTDGQRLE